MNLFLSVEYVVLVIYLHDLRYVTVCVCMSIICIRVMVLFLHCLRVHPDIRHKNITLLDVDSVRVSKLGLMNICHEQRIVFSSENKKPAVGIS